MRRPLGWLGPALFWSLASVALFVLITRALPESSLVVGEGQSAWEFLEPRAFTLLALLPMLALGAFRSMADLPAAQQSMAIVLRALAIALLAVALARPTHTRDVTRVALVVLVDVSDSVTDDDLERARAFLQSAQEQRGDGFLALVTFARHARVVPLDGELLAAETGPIERHEDGSASAPATAIELALGLFPAGHLRRIALLSDGAQTEGDVVGTAARAAELGVRVDHVLLDEGPPPEVAVTGLEIPAELRAGAPFTVRVRVFSTAATQARVRLFQGPAPNGAEPYRDATLEAGDNLVEMRSIVHVAGPVTYRAQVEPEGQDRFEDNNSWSETVLVPGRPRVLYVEGAAGQSASFARALEAGELEVEVRGARGIPTSVSELEQFDFFVLSDVGADEVTLAQEEAIERWVRDRGGAFLMSGGGHAFGPGGWQGSRLERIMPVRMDGERRRETPSLALALVIDRSGSMSGEKIELAKEAARATAQLLSSEDYLGVIGFDAQPERIVRMQSAGNRLGILRDIGRLAARGGTAIFPALDMAYQDLSVTRARIKHVILLTDGVSQEPGLPELVSVMRSEGITVSTVGVGDDVNRTLLAEIADLGGGRSYFTTDPHNIPRIFVRETSSLSRSSVVEEYFRPQVTSRAAFLRGVDVTRGPWLHGYVTTRARPRPAEVILTSDVGEPLLARMRVGLGWTLAWTSDVKPRWAAEWVRWPGFSQLFVQLVREHLREEHRRELPMRAEVEGDEIRVVVDAIDESGAIDSEAAAAGGFLSGLTSTVRLDGPMGAPRAERMPREAPLQPVAPGLYEARFPIEQYGSFVLSATHARGGEQVAESVARIALPYPREYARVGPDAETLTRVSSAAGGSALSDAAPSFDPGQETLEARQEARAPFMLGALLCFLFDLLLRRVRLFDRGFRASRA